MFLQKLTRVTNASVCVCLCLYIKLLIQQFHVVRFTQPCSVLCVHKESSVPEYRSFSSTIKEVEDVSSETDESDEC